METLYIAELLDGDISALRHDSTIWLDLSCDRGRWIALVATRREATVVAAETGATLLSVSPWDGAPHGDGNCGTVRSEQPGVLIATHPEFVTPPHGWEVRRDE